MNTMKEVARELLKEQRSARRWKNAFRFSVLALVGAVVFSSVGDDVGGDRGPHTAVVKIRGEIADDSPNSATNVNAALRKAFGDKNTKGVIIYINSPGGSPVQAGQIADEIHRLRGKHPEKPAIAVIGDLGASGGYYVASAAQTIYADKASLVGSIGVTAASFGYVDLMKTLGVQRRAYTSGKHKAFLDPFQPENEAEKVFWSGVLQKTHDQFIAEVRKGRGDRLKESKSDEIFSGLIWSGEQAKDLGLIDALASVETVSREVIKAPRLVDFTINEDKFEVLARKLGAQVMTGAMDSIAAESDVSLR